MSETRRKNSPDRLGAVRHHRGLQDRTYEVLGSTESLTLEVRVVSAANRDLTAGHFRGEGHPNLCAINQFDCYLAEIGRRGGGRAAGDWRAMKRAAWC